MSENSRKRRKEAEDAPRFVDVEFETLPSHVKENLLGQLLRDLGYEIQLEYGHTYVLTKREKQ